jgi:hypothetical protein
VVAEDECDGIRRAVDLILEEGMDEAVRKVDGGVVPFEEEEMALCGGEEVDEVEARRGEKGEERGAEMGRDA